MMNVRMLALAALVVGGCGGGSSDVTGGVAPGGTTVAIEPSGGTLRSGELQVDFPANSVSGPVTVSDEVVTLGSIPRHLKPVSAIHKIEISRPEHYKARTARVSFSLPTQNDFVSVYHSDDGVNWQTLGSGSSAKTHKFSYFFAGEIDTAAGSSYTVQVQNRSGNFGTAYIYRQSADPEVFSVAMMAMQLAPQQTWWFRWSETYDFFASQTQLVPGVQLIPWQTVGTSLAGNNFATLNSYGFAPPTVGPANALSILSNIFSPGQLTIGVGISGYPALATQAFPQEVQEFHPTGPYYIAFTPEYLESGTVLFPPIMNNALLPGNNVQAVFNPQQTWTFPQL